LNRLGPRPPTDRAVGDVRAAARRLRGLEPPPRPAKAAPPPLDARAWAMLAVWILAPVTAATAIGLLFAPDAGYAALDRPTWAPPAWLYAPIRTLLFALVGLAGWLVAREPGVAPAERRGAWAVFAVQAALAIAWAPLFFGADAIGKAFVVLCLLWPAALWTTMRFGRIRPLAGYLLVPYVLWVSFALVLNGTLWLMNE
jgi:translocator protein